MTIFIAPTIFWSPGKPTKNINRKVPQDNSEVDSSDFFQNGTVGITTSETARPKGPVASKNIIASFALIRNSSAVVVKNIANTLSPSNNAPIITGKLLKGDKARPITGRKTGAA